MGKRVTEVYLPISCNECHVVDAFKKKDIVFDCTAVFKSEQIEFFKANLIRGRTLENKFGCPPLNFLNTPNKLV